MTIPTSQDIARTLAAVEADISRRAAAGTLIPDGTPCETVNTSDGHIAFITASDLHAVFADRPDWAYPAWGLHDFYDMETLCRLIPDLLAHGGVRRLVDEWARLADDDGDEA